MRDELGMIETYQKARNEYKCGACGEPILKGETYRKLKYMNKTGINWEAHTYRAIYKKRLIELRINCIMWEWGIIGERKNDRMWYEQDPVYHRSGSLELAKKHAREAVDAMEDRE